MGNLLFCCSIDHCRDYGRVISVSVDSIKDHFAQHQRQDLRRLAYYRKLIKPYAKVPNDWLVREVAFSSIVGIE